MTSIFTFDDNPPRVSSPWLQVASDEAGKGLTSASDGVDSDQVNEPDVDRLDAEPQDGPIEYKLHLLLRPRRQYDAMSTTSRVAGSQQAKEGGARSTTKPSNKQVNTPLSSSSQSRQNRIQQLTTQLLWRLQQSAPHHAVVKGELVLPKLPEDSDDLENLVKPRQLLPGLEESNGALYEIGVSDDGIFVGLTRDEMDESMTILKVMAASLGCRVEVQRMKVVGTCSWNEIKGSETVRRDGDLWVAEALVVPILEPQKDGDYENAGLATNGSLQPIAARSASKTEQLRISLIGPTTSGKTTLLGALVNGTLDNGRGSSRIDLLRHSHERVSGQTSSVAQELLGYKGDKIYNFVGTGSNIDIKTWTDIHDRAEDGRLVFISDSAGHLRFRRTILRGLVGWAPHWTLLCIAANEADVSSRRTHSLSGTTDDLGDVAGSTHLAIAHLDLCLKLEVPMVIVVTKYDLATKDTLKSTLSTVFSKIKAAGRIPKLLMPPQFESAELTKIPNECQQKVTKDIIQVMQASDKLQAVVPVVLTSAVKGQGIGLTHALLCSLPMPPPPTARDYVGQVLNPEQPAALFHIDDKYKLPAFRQQEPTSQVSPGNAIVVAGYLRFGNLSIGDKVVLGPFPADDDDEDMMPRDHPSPGRALSFPNLWAMRNAVSASAKQGEWHSATIVNIRNLRLPVRSMEAGQAGTIQVAFDEPVEEPSDTDPVFERRQPPNDYTRKIRKGQVLAIPTQHMLDTGLPLQAATGFRAAFTDPGIESLSIGSLVNVYVATVRAAARILRVASQLKETEEVFNVDIGPGKPGSKYDSSDIEHTVSLELLTNREWIELGSQVVLIEGGNKDGSGLEGYVGSVVEILE